jgi:hypothetical protein
MQFRKNIGEKSFANFPRKITLTFFSTQSSKIMHCSCNSDYPLRSTINSIISSQALMFVQWALKLWFTHQNFAVFKIKISDDTDDISDRRFRERIPWKKGSHSQLVFRLQAGLNIVESHSVNRFV